MPTTTLKLNDPDDRDCLVEIDFRIRDYSPAYTSGPPESCCPAEGEVEIHSVTLLEIDGKEVENDPALVRRLEEIHEDKIDSRCWEVGLD